MQNLTKALLFLALTLTGCASQPPANAWQVKSVNAFEKYQRYYLENRTILADSERKKAIAFAKQSAHFETLARVYLSDCAIQYAALNPTECSLYQSVASLEPNSKLQAYFHLLTQQYNDSEISLLPEHYQQFARILLKAETSKLQETILAIPNLDSRLIAAAIAKPKLELKTLRVLIDQTADVGYKLASTRWMAYLASITPDTQEAHILQQKILLMNTLP